MRVAVSWSGGKDSCLAYQKAIAQGHEVGSIITFLWENPSVAHPIRIIDLQAKTMRVKQVKMEVREPYFEQYRKAIAHITEEERIEGIVTGDMAIVDPFHGNWMENVCKNLGVKVIKPLWNADRRQIIEELLYQGIRAVFSCVKQPWFSVEWIGRELNWKSLEELEALREKSGMDLCGENGEYHTIILDAPFFDEAIEISKYTKEKRNGTFFINIEEISLKPKSMH